MHPYIAEKVLHHIMSVASQDLIVYFNIVEELYLLSKESFYDFCLYQLTQMIAVQFLLKNIF